MSYSSERREDAGRAVLISGGVVLGLALIAGIIIAGHYFGWWLQSQDISHENSNYQNSRGTQQADITQFGSYTAQIATITMQAAVTTGQEQSALISQRVAIGNQACALAQSINPQPPSVSSWVTANCSGGAVSATSSLRKSS